MLSNAETATATAIQNGLQRMVRIKRILRIPQGREQWLLAKY